MRRLETVVICLLSQLILLRGLQFHNAEQMQMRLQDVSPIIWHNNTAAVLPTSINVKPLSLIVAKTLSPKDVKDTLLDILYFRDNLKSTEYRIDWRLFCYKNETYNALLNQYSLETWQQDYQTTIYLKEKGIKNNFWSPYLDPAMIPGYVDYVWVPDGDIRIRSMAWDCFWQLVRKFQPSIFAPAIMASSDSRTEDSKTYTGSSHPYQCYADSSKPNVFERVVAMDVSMVENQLPIFTRRAWEIIHREFTKGLPEWGGSRTNWGADFVWCGLIDFHVHGIQMGERFHKKQPSMLWSQSRKECHIDEQLLFDLPADTDITTYHDKWKNATYPHACMIFHSTPIEHLDTKAVAKHAKNSKEKREYMKDAHQELGAFLKAFREFRNNGKKKVHVSLHRVYTSSNEEEYKCQTCKHRGCTT